MGSNEVVPNLSNIRTEQERWMPNSAIRQRKVPISPDEEGTDTLPGLKCRISAGFGTFRMVADKFQGITPYHFAFPWDSDVKVGDYLVDEQSNTYRVVSVKEDVSIQSALPVLTDRVN
jgi:hypothetical protein